ncbi:MAG: transcriptional repressor LexA [Candidatus Dojkabacteria bacterium]|jgi:repressor LexA|nr:transcriptional repressor LexA [Candidatus Dojkabacteria bacterium]
MDEKLTEKQENVLRIVRNFFLDNGYAPSLTELQTLLNISTKRGVVGHLEALERKGYIIRTSEARGIQIIADEDDQEVYEYLVGIPILGYANAGTPMVIAQEQSLGTLQADRSLVGSSKDLFGLIIKGDSMNMRDLKGKKLEEGHYLVVQRDSDFENGDVVVAIVDGCATVKNIRKEDDVVILYPQSSNPIHKPIYLDVNSDSMINGKVIKVLENPNI